MNEIISTEAVNTLVGSGVFGYLGKKVLGAALENIGKDVANLYEKGRDKIIEKTSEKIENLEDGQQVNLRVARDVFYNGSFSEEEICAEYFGGILASARSEDGKDDSGMFYLDLIKSLSSKELKLHYYIYHALNSMFNNGIYSQNLNVNQQSEITPKQIFIPLISVISILHDNDVARLLHILIAKNLISSFSVTIETITNNHSAALPYICVAPTPVGIQTYAISHNKETSEFTTSYWGRFNDIEVPELFASSLENLKQLISQNK